MLDLGTTPPDVWLTSIATGLAVMFGVLAAYATHRSGEARVAREQAEREVEDVDLVAVFENGLSDTSDDVTWGQVRSRMVMKPTSADMDRLTERLSALEERFPDATTIDKIASVNDAIMATKIEALEKAVADLKDKMLTKWDVAVVLFAVLGGFSGVVALGARLVH